MDLNKTLSSPTGILSIGEGKKVAFTLAEVLITLGIIGVVAAMTIPSLMTKYEKIRTEKQLVKFYSTINQAVRLSVADNGTPEGWITPNKDYSYNQVVGFLQTYILPYMKYSSYEKCKVYSAIGASNNNRACVQLFDGGIMTLAIDANGGDLIYFTHTNKCPFQTGKDVNNIQRYMFAFQFSKKSGLDDSVNSSNFVEPYIFGWGKTRNSLKNNGSFGCNKNNVKSNYCTKLIQLNSWKIPDDYPW